MFDCQKTFVLMFEVFAAHDNDQRSMCGCHDWDCVFLGEFEPCVSGLICFYQTADELIPGCSGREVKVSVRSSQ